MTQTCPSFGEEIYFTGYRAGNKNNPALQEGSLRYNNHYSGLGDLRDYINEKLGIYA